VGKEAAKLYLISESASVLYHLAFTVAALYDLYEFANTGGRRGNSVVRVEVEHLHS
jgi:hypothetical protein